MFKSKSLIAIILASTVLVVTVVGVAFMSKTDEQRAFEQSGYILTSNSEKDADGGQVEVAEYFNQDEAYKIKWPDKLVFSNTAGNTVTTGKDKFIHYSNGDLVALSDGVLMDADKLNQNPVAYYDIKEGTVIKKVNGGYEITTGTEKKVIKNFIWKLSENKYMMVSDKINLDINGEQKKSMEEYVEVEFVDGGIVRVLNKSVRYQTIAPNSVLALSNNIGISLEDKGVYQGENKLVNLQQMVVNADDNIEVIPEDNKVQVGNNGNEQTADNNGENGSGGGGGGAGGTGNGQNGNGQNGNGQNGNGQNGNNENNSSSNSQNNSGEEQQGDAGVANEVNIPDFSMTKFETTSIKISAQIQVTDHDFLLTDDTEVKLIEIETGEVKDITTYASSSFNIDYSNETLKPDTNYMFVVTGTYAYKGQQFTREFISRHFKTNSIGVNYVKESVSQNAMSFKINVDQSTKVSGADLIAYDYKGNRISASSISIEDAKRPEGTSINLTGLTPNTVYKIAIRNVIYDGNILSTEFDDGIQITTLKEIPKIGEPNVFVDKRNGNFEVDVKNVDDPQGGVTGIRYELFTPNNTEIPIVSVKRKTPGSQLITVDNNKIFRNTMYVFNATLEFYDNEKTVEIASVFSKPFSMDGAKFPELEFKLERAYHDRFNGEIYIDNSSGTLDTDTNLKYQVKNSAGFSVDPGTVPFTDKKPEMKLPFTLTNLRANETYTVEIRGIVDYKDGNAPSETLIGSFTVATGSPTPFNIEYKSDISDPTKSFNLTVQLKDFVPDATNRPNEIMSVDHEAGTISSMKVELFKGEFAVTDERVAEKIVSNDKGATSPDVLTNSIRKDWYKKAMTFGEDFFGKNKADLTETKYTIRISNMFDYTRAKNQLNFASASPKPLDTFTFKTTANAPAHSAENDAITVTEVRERELSTNEQKPEIDDNTIVSYKVKAKFDNKDKILTSITYTPILVEKDGTEIELTKLAKEVTQAEGVADLGEVEFKLVDGGAKPDANTTATNGTGLTRGYSYKFKYEAKLDLNYDKTAETNYPSNGVVLKSRQLNVAKQEPTLKAFVQKMEPSGTTTGNTPTTVDMTLKVKVSDIDGAVVDKQITYINDSKTQTFKYDGTHGTNGTNNQPDADGFVEVKLTGLSYGELEMTTKTKILDSQQQNKNVNLWTYNIVNPDTYLTDVKFSAEAKDNNLIITVKDGNNTVGQSDNLNKIASYDITVTATTQINNGTQENEYKFTNRALENTGKIYIPFIDIKDLLNRDFKVKVEAYVDSGMVVYDELTKNTTTNPPTDYYTLMGKNSSDEFEYLALDTNSNLTQKGNKAEGSIFSNFKIAKGSNGAKNTVEFENNYTNVKKEFKYDYDFDFLSLKGQVKSDNTPHNIIIKKLEKKEIQEDNTNTTPPTTPKTLKFTQIIPEITNVSVTRVGLTDFTMKFDVDRSAGYSDVDQSKITVEVFSNGQSNNGTTVTTQQSNADDDKKTTVSVSFTGLTNNTNYDIKIKAKVKDEAKTSPTYQYVDTYLYDKVHRTVGQEYKVKTLDHIKITNITHKVVANAVNDYDLQFRYNLSDIQGISNIEYKLFKEKTNPPTTGGADQYEEMTKVDFTTQPTTNTGHFNNIDITYPNTGTGNTNNKSADIVLGKKYKVEIKVYMAVNGKDIEMGSEEHEFTPEVLKAPTSFVVADKIEKDKMTVKSTVFDPEFTVTSADYELKLYETDDKTKEIEVTGVTDNTKHLISDVNKEQKLEAKQPTPLLKENTSYTVKVIMQADTNLDGAKETINNEFTFKTLDDTGISLGDVYIEADKNNASSGGATISIFFENSVNLENTRIENLAYTIYDPDGKAINGTQKFTPALDSVTGTKTITIGANLTKKGPHSIQLQFLDKTGKMLIDYSDKFRYKG